MTIDLTTITTPFGLLDEETQAQLQAAHKAGMLIELFVGASWAIAYEPDFSKTITYRLTPGQVWPKPEPKREVRYVHLWDDGCVSLNRDKLDGRYSGIHIVGRARVEVVKGHYDD